MSDITIGQYVEGRSLIHRLDVRVKLVLMLCGITFVFIAGNYFSMALITAFTIFIMLLTGISLFKYIKSIKAVIMIVLFTAILNLFYGSGEPIFKWGFMEITEAGINNAVFVAARVILIVLMSGVLTFTTSPTDLTDGLERIMKPLKIFRNITSLFSSYGLWKIGVKCVYKPFWWNRMCCFKAYTIFICVNA